MLVFANEFSYSDPLNIIFLCGAQYLKRGGKKPREKRDILKKYLESTLERTNVIILEENFCFGKTTKNYLSYDDVFLKNLAQVEQLASLYANKIIIIHETISTAAEIGMFAINPTLSSKMCLLTPDDFSIEEEKVSGFIKLAFMNRETPESNIKKRIVFYPDIEVKRYSQYKSEYHTFFHNDEIGENLGNEITAFAKLNNVNKQVIFGSCSYGKPRLDSQIVNYHIDVETGAINVFVHIEALKIQLLSLFYLNDFKNEIHKSKHIKEHVKFICEKYKEILKNTAAYLAGVETNTFEIKVELKNSVCDLWQAVGYYLYILQAIQLVKMVQSGDNADERCIEPTQFLKVYEKEIKAMISIKKDTAFGRLSHEHTTS